MQRCGSLHQPGGFSKDCVHWCKPLLCYFSTVNTYFFLKGSCNLVLRGHCPNVNEHIVTNLQHGFKLPNLIMENMVHSVRFFAPQGCFHVKIVGLITKVMLMFVEDVIHYTTTMYTHMLIRIPFCFSLTLSAQSI